MLAPMTGLAGANSSASSHVNEANGGAVTADPDAGRVEVDDGESNLTNWSQNRREHFLLCR
jgi:hypothetical protein